MKDKIVGESSNRTKIEGKNKEGEGYAYMAIKKG